MYKHTEISLIHVKYGKNQDRLKVLKTFFFSFIYCSHSNVKKFFSIKEFYQPVPKCVVRITVTFFSPIKPLLGTNMETN